MTVHHGEITVETRGHGHVVDLSREVALWLTEIEAGDGLLTVFVPGSTAAITTIEFEPGAVADLQAALERIAPSDASYAHDQRWGDGNGFSHLRAALMGPSMTVPVAGGVCVLGTWQQPILVDCDNRTRARRIVLTFLGTTVEGDA